MLTAADSKTQEGISVAKGEKMDCGEGKTEKRGPFLYYSPADNLV